MKFFYAMGGGWGHLYRLRVFVNQHQLSSFKVVTNNLLAHQLFREDQIQFVSGDTPAMLAQQIKIILQPAKEVYIDTFPVGLFGELSVLNATRIYYLARRLKWNVYKKLVGISTPRFDHTYLLEELEAEHDIFVQHHSKAVSTLALAYPSPAPERIPAALIPARQPIWLIVHAFIKEEVDMLVSYAQEAAHIEKQSPAFVLLSDQRIDDVNVHCHTYFPACDWFPLAEKIFVAGGFNTMHQISAYRDKVKVIPFPRKYDDQLWRVNASVPLAL